MPKNVTIYLSDEIAGKMEKYQEVNWSEICRKAVIDYIDTRSNIDLGPLIEKLKAERNEAYKQGQILFYKIAPEMGLRDFEIWYPKINQTLIEDICIAESTPLPAAAATTRAIRGMAHMMGSFCREKNIPYPSDASDAFWQGAIAAFMSVFTKFAKVI